MKSSKQTMLRIAYGQIPLANVEHTGILEMARAELIRALKKGEVPRDNKPVVWARVEAIKARIATLGTRPTRRVA